MPMSDMGMKTNLSFLHLVGGWFPQLLVYRSINSAKGRPGGRAYFLLIVELAEKAS